MNPAFSDLITRAKAAGRITADDTLAARRIVYGDGGVEPDAAQAVVDFDEAIDERAPEWDDFFVEAMVDFVVHQQNPVDYVDQTKADWVMTIFTRGGRIRTDSQLEALAHIFEEATSVPPSLTAFALATLKTAILTGEGPLKGGGRMQKGQITAGDVDLLRRVLFAAGGHGEAAISRAAADTLFDINDACRGAANDPAWPDFFAKAVTASMMTASGYAPESRDDALRDEAWVESKSSLAGFARSALRTPDVAGAMGEFFDPARDYENAWKNKDETLEAAESAAAPVSDADARWLMARIGRGGAYDDAERRLIQFLKQSGAQISPLLQPLLGGGSTSAGDEETAAPPVFGRRAVAPSPAS